MKTVLVADDDVITRKVVKSMCRSLGYRVLERADGRKALSALKRGRVDIVISDWIMPEVNGLSLCEQLHVDPSKPAPYVLLMTAKKKGLKNYAEALAAGADDFLYKPVDFFVFRNQLRSAEEALAKQPASPPARERRAYDKSAYHRGHR
jgi:sigma-B regulation protein RsbU (phosphoserine phosphatase)